MKRGAVHFSSCWNFGARVFPAAGIFGCGIFQRLEACGAGLSRGWKIFFAAVLCAAAAARGLGPQEIVLVVNGNSAASREVANHYVKLRGVPVRNVVFLDVPAGWGGGDCSISPEVFREKIWGPVTNEVGRRRLGDHVLAWVFSADFPTTVSAPKPVSLHGMVFLKGELIEPERIDRAKFASPFFRGPVEAGAARGDSLSLEQFAVALGTNLPIPAMTLGHLAPRGMTASQIVESLRFAARADFLRPDAVVNFVDGSDVRARCRAWQFPDLANEFAELGVSAVVTTNVPDSSRGLVGLQMGAAEIYSGLRVRLSPGAMAEHLTSFGAAFASADQTKITEWMKIGAAGSAGTVTEPYAIWSKFPHARFYAHYARGCTMLEAFVQSLGCPLQTFLLGDPLCRPFARQRSLVLVPGEGGDENLVGTNEFLVVEGNGLAPRDLTFICMVDGAVSLFAGNGPRPRVDASRLADGWHELRVTGYSGGRVRQQYSASRWFSVRGAGRSVAIAGPEVKSFAMDAPVELRLEATAGAEAYAVLAQGRAIASGSNAVLSVDFSAAGPGPVWLQAAARYADGTEVRSRARMVELVSKAAQ